jgi:hypothetical protein
VVAKKFGLLPPHEKQEKKFAFLKFHVEEDHKHSGSIDSRGFFANPVMLKTDRFLEKDLRSTMQLGISRPYTLVLDTAGCNKNCWFCYAYPIVKKRNYDKCKTICLSPEDLTRCFVDKLRSLKNSVKKKDRFFSKLRITGGEPLFSTEDTLLGAKTERYSFETIDYFLRFFEMLDPLIAKLVLDREIFLSTPKPYSSNVPFPTFLCSSDNRIEIRFDTNGFLFADRMFADKFIGGIYTLFQSGKLKNLLIRIDYSLKGVHPLEVYWSQTQELPVDEKKIGDFKVEDHPQYAGLRNTFDLIQEYSQKNPTFSSCFGITVEPGINNVKGNYLNYVGSLNWKLLERKLKEKLGPTFRLSDVDNKMEVRGKIHTHLKRGAAVKVVYGGTQFLCLPTDSEAKKRELFNLMRELKNRQVSFVKIYIPYTRGSEQNCHQQQSIL